MRFNAPPTCNARNGTASQPIQRGTKRPVGKSEKTRNSKKKASTFTVCTGTCKTEGIVFKELKMPFVPCITSINETNKASQSLDLRQKITKATTNHTRVTKIFRASENAE